MQFFWTLFKRPLNPPPLSFEHHVVNFLKRGSDNFCDTTQNDIPSFFSPSNSQSFYMKFLYLFILHHLDFYQSYCGSMILSCINFRPLLKKRPLIFWCNWICFVKSDKSKRFINLNPWGFNGRIPLFTWPLLWKIHFNKFLMPWMLLCLIWETHHWKI